MSGALAGLRIVVTRPRAQAAELVEGLERLGAEVVEFPTIRIAGPIDPGPLRAAAAGVGGYDWVVFTSANAVERFLGAMRAQGRDAAALAGVRICAVGPATARALEDLGARADVVPAEYVAESLVSALQRERSLRGLRILFPRAERVRPVVPDALRAAGAELHEVVAYRTLPDGAGAAELRARLRAGEIDLITFTSGSTVRNFVELVGRELGGARVACIGPVTAGVAEELGLPVDVAAEEYTAEGLVAAVVAAFRDGSS